MCKSVDGTLMRRSTAPRLRVGGFGDDWAARGPAALNAPEVA